MLEIETQFGCFAHFKDLLLFMQEEHLQEMKIMELRYCFSEIFGKGIYTLKQIKEIVEGD
ncbi:hypothetical protein CBE01nite_29920 [Clostridium beijerinckii]|uniref:Uncharacterized protein n=1 Tax=Clostridium beijerinckii TaxID=1520 RepID=A0AB74VDG4_CLOBE|nr:hypothetical protein [Clostridium beijerinckii]NRZ28771.1 hypothetical protein [Clostridium beijerinckii]NYB95453.1 hypothetical protein [Clostridium beijerinckii]OOM24568.1 hypothetical protein CLBEI_20290 [Clostridium beijerinckii]QUN34447.1 hypothetical protein KEC93_21370 [Clostridium beijerinckii]SQB00597.1 Uncharacterised protein [Clostridium beijerinckii]